LEHGDAETAAGGAAPAHEEEVETLARDLSESGAHLHDVDTPFAWTDEAGAHEGDHPEGIADWFERLLEWGEREEP